VFWQDTSFFGAGGKKGFLVLSIVPLTILKNGVRIVTLSLLSIYIDESFMTGALHQRGGNSFFLMALAFLLPLLSILRWVDGTRGVHRNMVEGV